MSIIKLLIVSSFVLVKCEVQKIFKNETQGTTAHYQNWAKRMEIQAEKPVEGRNTLGKHCK